MDKNTVIAEMLYIIFVHYKCCGKHYKTRKLKNEMYECMIAAKLLFKDSLSADNIQHIRRMLDVCGQYITTDTKNINLNDLTGGSVEITDPADKICEIIGKVISESSGFFVRDRIALYLYALHNLPLVYVSDNVNYLGNHIKRLRPDEALKYCNEWLGKVSS